MTDPRDAEFVNQIKQSPEDNVLRAVYANWLEERGDPRSPFVRLHAKLRTIPPDHSLRPSLESELSDHRAVCPQDWLDVVEPERAHLSAMTAEAAARTDSPQPQLPMAGPLCNCTGAGWNDSRRMPMPKLHDEPQDTTCRPWLRLCEMIEEAVADGREEFAPIREFAQPDRAHIVTLPPSIARLKAVRKFVLYGSNLVQIPPEIGEMSSLREFVPYTSYRLHWYPYEITRCPKLRDSTVSTRALYGNSKSAPPFPRLDTKGYGPVVTRPCSVCRTEYEDRGSFRRWVSLPVATDVLPLLVNACSNECLRSIPESPTGYADGPHRGGRKGLSTPRFR